AVQASAAQVPCCARSRAAPNSDTSWRSSPGSIRKPVPPPAGSSLQQKQTVEPLRKSPLQTSPAALPNQGSKRVSPESGRVLLRHAAAICRRSVAYYCSAAYSVAGDEAKAADDGECAGELESAAAEGAVANRTAVDEGAE